MQHIFLIRHGQSLWNSSNIKQCLDDYELSELWKQQSEAINLWIEINEIFTSTYKRAIDTAKIIARNHQFDESEIVQDKRLREWEVFNDKKWYELTEENRKKINPYLLRYPAEISYWNWESFLDIHSRLYEFLEEYIYSDTALGNVVIVSHAATINHLIYLLLFWKTDNSDEHYDFITKFNHIKNTWITKIINKDWKYLIDFFNR